MEEVRPEHRTRLFLSVDLVGSTAFKAGIGSSSIENSANPMWVDEIRTFYQEFPSTLRQRYTENTTKPEYESLYNYFPSVWKTIGDELIFCCRVRSNEHLVCIVNSFIEAMDDYGRVLDVRCKHLDVKGTGWLAAFPAPNISVDVQTIQASELPTEEIEARADTEPQRCDFLGPGIDCGFRLSKFSSTDKLTISVELAYSLCMSANKHNRSFYHKFTYVGREELKGVIGGRPYPVVAINTERRALRREVLELERGVRGISSDTSPMALRNFLEKFMQDEQIELPIFSHIADPAKFPKSYIKFTEAWDQAYLEKTRRENSEALSATQEPNDASDTLPSEVESTVNDLENRAALLEKE